MIHFLRKFASRVKHISFSGILNLSDTSLVYVKNFEKNKEKIAENHFFYLENVYKHGKKDQRSLCSFMLVLRGYKKLIESIFARDIKYKKRYERLKNEVKNNTLMTKYYKIL